MRLLGLHRFKQIDAHPISREHHNWPTLGPWVFYMQINTICSNNWT